MNKNENPHCYTYHDPIERKFSSVTIVPLERFASASLKVDVIMF